MYESDIEDDIKYKGIEEYDSVDDYVMDPNYIPEENFKTGPQNKFRPSRNKNLQQD